MIFPKQRLWLQNQLYSVFEHVGSLRSQFNRGGLILLYHRICESDFDPFQMNVSLQNFTEQMEALKITAEPMCLEDLSNRLKNGLEIKNRVAVTFDDGYATNINEVNRILAHHEIPATFFVVNEALQPGFEFWWDELERLMGDEDGSQVLYLRLCNDIRSLSASDRQIVMDEIRSQSYEEEPSRRKHEVLTRKQVLDLAALDHITIGSHSTSHADLSCLGQNHLHFEIVESKLQLEALIDRGINSFSYPHGHHSNTTHGIVKNAGYTIACSSVIGGVTPNVDPYLLPRIQVGDWNGDEFTKFLRRWIV